MTEDQLNKRIDELMQPEKLRELVHDVAMDCLRNGQKESCRRFLLLRNSINNDIEEGR